MRPNQRRRRGRFKEGVLANGPDRWRVRLMEDKAFGPLRDYSARRTEDVEQVLCIVMDYSLEFGERRQELSREVGLSRLGQGKAVELRGMA